MMRFNDYSINNIKTILKFYETNNVLSSNDREVLKIDLMFPHCFFGLVKTLHKNSNPINGNRISEIARFEQNKFSALLKWL